MDCPGRPGQQPGDADHREDHDEPLREPAAINRQFQRCGSDAQCLRARQPRMHLPLQGQSRRLGARATLEGACVVCPGHENLEFVGGVTSILPLPCKATYGALAVVAEPMAISAAETVIFGQDDPGGMADG